MSSLDYFFNGRFRFSIFKVGGRSIVDSEAFSIVFGSTGTSWFVDKRLMKEGSLVVGICH